MKSSIIDACYATVVRNIYPSLRYYSDEGKKEACIARLAAFPVALVDATCETLRTPLKVIEALVMTVLNLLGALFCSEDWTVRGVISNSKKMVACVLLTPVALIMFLPHLLYQFTVILYDPTEARPLSPELKFSSTDGCCVIGKDSNIFVGDVSLA